MKSVTIAELKNRLEDYVAMARRGEEIVICSKNRPIAMLAPLTATDATEEDLQLAAEGKSLPELSNPRR